ncbi:MAG: hypothetical protein ACLP4V_13570 [Methylocella sp.]
MGKRGSENFAEKIVGKCRARKFWRIFPPCGRHSTILEIEPSGLIGLGAAMRLAVQEKCLASIKEKRAACSEAHPTQTLIRPAWSPCGHHDAVRVKWWKAPF